MADDYVSKVWEDRSAVFGAAISEWDDLVGVYLGTLPSKFDEFFHEEMHRHIVNMIRLSWDDLASLAGKVFPIYVDPDNETPTAKERAEKLEKIGYGYNEAGRIAGAIDMSMLMKVYAWWMSGVGEAVGMTLPDYDRHTPYFTFRDPRHYLPPVGSSPFTQKAPDDALFAYQMALGELKRRFPDKADEIDSKLGTKAYSSAAAFTRTTDSTVVYVGEYYHADAWITQTLTDKVVTLDHSEHDEPDHPGIVPVVGMSLYSPAARARSIFSDQVSVQAAMARMFSQKLDYADRSLYPIIFTSPLADKLVRVGPWAINEWDPTFQGQFRAQVIGPTNAIDFDQTMAFVTGLQRMLNRNPESFQGQAPGGRADSAKALASLRDSVVNTTIREMLWPPMIQALPKLYTKAAQIDLALWPNERKRAAGRRKNQAFRQHYRPQVDLRDREDEFQIEPGIGLAGYQGTLEILQLVGAELLGEDEAIEQGEWSRDAAETKRGVQNTRMEKLLWQDLQAKAANGLIAPGAMAKLKRLINEGTDMFDAMEQLETAGELLVQPPAAPELAPGQGGAPGAPVPPGIMPPLEVLQGGRR